MATSAPSAEDLSGVAVLAQTLYRLEEAHRRFRAHIAQDAALPATELAALLLIADTPGISPTALASDLGLTTGAVTALLDRLENTGHTTRTPNRTDRRGLQIRLTETGQNTLATMRDSYQTALLDAGTDSALTAVLPQLDNITTALNAAARNQHPTATHPTRIASPQ
jgi:DNA-binding MarR family transcriptional regulator